MTKPLQVIVVSATLSGDPGLVLTSAIMGTNGAFLPPCLSISVLCSIEVTS